MMSQEEKNYIWQALRALDNIGNQLKRIADLKQKQWNEDHHNYMEDEEADVENSST